MANSAHLAMGVCAALSAPPSGNDFFSTTRLDSLPNPTIADALHTQMPALSNAVFDAKTCTLLINGRSIKLQGKFQRVDAFPDFKVKEVKHFADLKVQRVTNFPDKCGKWQEVQHFADFKIKLVSDFPDLKIEYVEHFPGTRIAIP